MFARRSKILTLAEVQSDTQLYAAAQLVDRTYGTKRDGLVTQSDLDHARADLRKVPRFHTAPPANERLAQLRDRELDLLESQLPRLCDFVHVSQPAKRRDFATSIPCELIANDELRACARLVAQHFGTNPANDDTLNLEELIEAEAALTNDPTAPKVKALADSDRVFTKENLAEISRFMRDGLGPLIRYPPMSVNGRVFNDVFRVPLRKLLSGADSRAQDAYKEAIKRVEKLLGNASFDRIYIRGKDESGLYVALNPRRWFRNFRQGSLDDIQVGYAVQLPATDGKYRDAGQILDLVDVNNSPWEASGLFIYRQMRKLADWLWSKAENKLDERLRSTAESAVNALGNAKVKPPSSPPAWVTASAAAAGILTVGASYFAAGPLVYTAVGVGSAILAGNAFNLVRKSSDLRPLYHALGVAVNVREKA